MRYSSGLLLSSARHPPCLKTGLAQLRVCLHYTGDIVGCTVTPKTATKKLKRPANMAPALLVVFSRAQLPFDQKQ